MGEDLRCAVSLLKVTIVRAVIDGPIGLPDRLAGVAVKGRYILPIEAVEGEDEQVLKKNG